MPSRVDVTSFFTFAHGRWLLAACLLLVGLARADRGPGEPQRDRIEALVEDLGSADYWRRESAAAELRRLGPSAIDPLLAAAERSDDLEIALAARWLVDGIPLAADSDPPEVAKLVEQYGRARSSDWLPVMQRLLRVDDDAGIEPLSRIVRLDRSLAASTAAAALLAAEWRRDDPSFPAIARRVAAGIGSSSRPTAAFLRGLVGFAGGDPGGVETAAAAIERLRATSRERPADGRPAGRLRRSALVPGGVALEDPVIGLPCRPGAILDRTFIAMLVAAGRRDQAVAESQRLLEEAVAEPEDLLRGYRIASVLAFSAGQGVPQLAEEALARHADVVTSHPIAMYAAAMALKAAGNAKRAEEVAAEARAVAADDHKLHLDAASKLSRWGETDWAGREYKSLTTDPAVPDAEFVAATIMFSEHLHDLGKDAEAAACLRGLLEPVQDPAAPNHRPPADDLLRQFGRDPRSTRSRMLFFEACAAESRGDRAARAKLLEQAIDGLGKDVDALIAAYHASADSPELRERRKREIRESLAVLEAEIESEPEEANALNEHAWLAANTDGDAERAIRYSKRSLALSFDNPSYLDTLAHGQALAGQFDRAVRTQSVAARLEPHNRTIRRNLERFREMAAKAKAP